MSLIARHRILENNSILLIIGILLVIAIGGIFEIAPLFYLKSTIEKVEGMRPYTPLELAGRNIYVREGCYLCHSQMIRTLRDEVERYGHYSLAAESMYDHPFQWGSKRTGPDLARVGGKYSDEWHVTHLIDPRAIVPQSVMPGYAFLSAIELDYDAIAAHLATNRAVGVPYTDDQISNAKKSIEAQSKKIVVNLAIGSITNAPADREIISVIAYLQRLGTDIKAAPLAGVPNLDRASLP